MISNIGLNDSLILATFRQCPGIGLLLQAVLGNMLVKTTSTMEKCQWLLANCYSQPPGTLGLSNINLGYDLDG